MEELVKRLHVLPLLEPRFLEQLFSRHAFHREQRSEQKQNGARAGVASKEAEVIHLGGTVWHSVCLCSSNETNNVRSDATNVCHNGPPVDSCRVEVLARVVGRVQVFQHDMALSDEVVVTEVDTCDGREEHRVCAQVGGEHAAGREQVPWTDSVADDGADEAASPDVDVFREQRSHVGTGRERVGGDVGTELGDGKAESDQENSSPGSAAVMVQKPRKDVQRVPVSLAVEHGACRRNEHADQRRDRKGDRDCDQLGVDGGVWLMRHSGEVRRVDDERGEVGERVHHAVHKSPAKGRPAELAVLVDHGAASVGLDQSPGQKRDASYWARNRLHREEMTDRVWLHVDRRQLEQPEQEERQHLERGNVSLQLVWYPGFEIVTENRPQHQGHTLASQHGLDAKPDACHHDSVDDGPQRTPDSPRRPGSNGKRDMVVRTVAGSQNHKAAAEGVPEPDGDPRDPPAESCLHSRGGDLPGIDVEGVCYPECDKIPPSPGTSFFLERFEVVVVQKQLGQREVLCAVQLEPFDQLPDLAQKPCSVLERADRLRLVIERNLPDFLEFFRHGARVRGCEIAALIYDLFLLSATERPAHWLQKGTCLSKDRLHDKQAALLPYTGNHRKKRSASRVLRAGVAFVASAHFLLELAK
ncbi:hypothetical protein KL912_003459 [Ogataea haglerorum]|nr:hypothetical protein KL912_003459 [Ogataea haglerorum]